MIIVRKYDKDGASIAQEFKNKFAALLWLNEHLEESEWCWIMYQKESEKE